MKNSDRNTNRLAEESSPYLLEHAHNPVDWYPWGDEAFSKAAGENKLIIISIGYSACHWCHVMMHESFEDEEVARVMNEGFVSVKIDREERPDIDQVYMNAVQILNGNGGWPLNVITLPDGRPVYGGTYFTRENWLRILKIISEYARENPLKTEEQAATLTNAVKSDELVSAPLMRTTFTEGDLDIIFNHWKQSFDKVNGGYSGAPKFPLPVGMNFLLHYYSRTGNKAALEAVTLTLDRMAAGGIYDQAGGGFARYSTDEEWLVPHFEKMLYDNAQLVSLYSSAYQLTRDLAYRKVVYETLAFVSRELSSAEGAFFSSLDADSEGEEGRFYVWRKDETVKILGKDAGPVCDYYGVTEEGNWEHGRNILHRSLPDSDFAARYDMSAEELEAKIAGARGKLLKARELRARPRTDDKIIASWNALMIKGYADAFRAFGEDEFIKTALRAAGFILAVMKKGDGSLHRIYREGKVSVSAFLDDYALVADAFISLYQATFDEKWLAEADSLAAYAVEHFSDPASGMFFYTSDLDPSLIARKLEITDNVMPSSNSVMALNLFKLGTYFERDDYMSRAAVMLNCVYDNALRGGPYYANWDILLAWLARPPHEVAVAGAKYRELLNEFNSFYLPDALFCGGENPD
ncbi:MAG: thioredoxin domain-containing protein [Bacteroidales bacterium]|nr:thioredoxin domain-containing protein [Bacteroidales bacterium]